MNDFRAPLVGPGDGRNESQDALNDALDSLNDAMTELDEPVKLVSLDLELYK